MVIYKTKMGIVHIQCLLRTDGSILAGVSSFCVVPESQVPLTQEVAAYLYMLQPPTT